ncbi:NUDIX domain protein [uncultured archaeon]|nr:NUDIX domain protein [uncultured archaeon]
MKSKPYKFVIKWQGKFYDCEWFEKYNFEDYSQIKNVHGFVFDDKGRVCIVRVVKKDHWSDLGGGVEKEDKTFEDTFIREVNEEADLDLKDLKRLALIKVTPRHDKKNIFYALRFVARVKKIKPQTIDPAEGTINERKFINPKEFNKYCNWGENGDYQIKRALVKLREKK